MYEEQTGLSGKAITALVTIGLVLIIAAIAFFTLILPSINHAGQSTGAHIGKQIQAPINAADSAAVQNDVHNAVTAVTTYAASNPGAADLSGLTLTSSAPYIHLSVSGTPAQYVITGTDANDGYAYSYTSATGQYAVVNPGR